MKEKILFKAKVDNTGLEEIIKNAGIENRESLAFFRTVYAELEKTNKNNVMLADSVREQVPQLVGTQVNFEHRRENNVCGSIIGAWVNNNNEIEVAFSFYKSIYNSEYEQALELLKENQLTVSFELMVENDDVETLSNGVRKLHAVQFDGMGLLMSNNPACPKAIVYEQADIDKLKKRDLVFANKLKESKIEKGESEMDKKTQEALLAEFKKDVIAELGEEAVKDWSDEQFEAELKKQAEAEEKTEPETTEASKSEAEESKEEEAKEETEDKESDEEASKEDETASYECECLECGKVISSEEHCKDIKCPECGSEMRRKSRPGSGDKAISDEDSEEKTEDKEEEKSEASEEQAEKTTVVVDEKIKTETTYDNETNEETVKIEVERTVERDGKKTVEEKVNHEVTYTYAQMEEVKAEYEKQLEEKDKEISFLKDNAKKVAEFRAELGEFVKDFSDEELFDETKLENARLKKQIHDLESKNVETASDESEAEEEAEEDLSTGHEEKEQVEEETSEDRVDAYLKEKYGNKK